MISAAIIAYNEATNIPDLMENLKELDDIVIVDTGSTDDTVKLAREMGAIVYEAGRSFHEKNRPTEDDISEFYDKFGYAPSFTTGMEFMNYGEVRNFAASLTENDWIFAIDCDERVEWQLSALKGILPELDMIVYTSRHTPTENLFHQKLYRKSKVRWNGFYHEFVESIDKSVELRQARIHDGMQVWHHQRPRAYRSNSLAIVEYMNIVDPNFRSLFYLGREYGTADMHHEAIQAFDMYMEVDNDLGAVNEALMLQGISYHRMGMDLKARHKWLAALERNPEFKDPYRLLALTSKYKEHQERWLSFAELATNNHVLQDRADDFWKDLEVEIEE